MDPVEEPLPIPGLPPIREKVQRRENPMMTEAEAKRVKWSKVRARAHCNVCVDEMVAAKEWTFVYPAVAQREQYGETVLYCYRHANEKRTQEGLDQIRAGSNGEGV